MNDKVIILRETYEDQEDIVEVLNFKNIPNELQKNLMHAITYLKSDMTIEQDAIGTLQWLYEQPHRDEYYYMRGDCNLLGSVTFRTHTYNPERYN